MHARELGRTTNQRPAPARGLREDGWLGGVGKTRVFCVGQLGEIGLEGLFHVS